ncbi:cell division protein FtsQ/DivIB [Mogibacterium pumilum]|uniref:POTRA domain-containing protein n=1 Tax=Mogibacterium pumilum TaxID=86332 RepID=A0A223ASC6_9FIRM|nr:FtsQ-type POTRA domain-containing protein [Mogibacterium pumilum]ASS37870.1 hypothetical protein AXF17_05025 [Mogibacterium pumilum]
MDKDNNTKPELNKEEYLESLFNGAKEELEAYIESKEESSSDESDSEKSAGSELKVDIDTDNSSTIDRELDEDDKDNAEHNLDNVSEDSASGEASSDEFEEVTATESEEISDDTEDVKGDENSYEKKPKAAIDDIEKRRIKRKRKLKMPGFFTRIFIVVGVTIVVIAFSLSSFFTVDTIDVQGNKYFTDEEIANMAHASTGRNILYKLNKGSMLKYLEKNPYIEEARIYRKLPSTIVINVQERMQIAALNYGDKFLIIDNKGTLLRITKTKPKLTIVTGFKVKQVKLGENVEVSDPELFKKLLTLLKSMEDGDVYFTKINITELFITANVYDSLVVRSKYKDLIENIDKGRLHKVLDELFKRNIKRGTITISSDGYASFTPEL